MAQRELQTILNSGELATIFLGSTGGDYELLIKSRILGMIGDGTLTQIRKGGNTAAEDVLTKTEIEAITTPISTDALSRMRFLDTWVPGTYETNDVVKYNANALYIANEQTDEEPGAGTDWTFLANATVPVVQARLEEDVYRVVVSSQPLGLTLQKIEVENALNENGLFPMHEGASFALTDGTAFFAVRHIGGEFYYERLSQAS